MSGEPPTVYFADDGDGIVARLLEAARLVAEHSGRPLALVGGLAVMARLNSIDRPTGDVDIVTDESATLEVGSLHDRPQRAGVAGIHPGRTASLDVAGIKVDVIETERFDPSDLDGLPEKEQLFIASHRWAVESATPLTLAVVGRDLRATFRSRHRRLWWS